MEYYWIDPEVDGGFGEGIDYDPTRIPALVGPMHYEFAAWPGGHITTSSPYLIVTRQLAQAIRTAGLTGVSFGGDVVVTREPQWAEAAPGFELPEWELFLPNGIEGRDDFWLSSRWDLAVSGKALELIRQIGLGDCRVYPVADYPNGCPRTDVQGMLARARARREARDSE